MRKDNPQFRHLVEEFAKTRAVGTSFGNTRWRRYIRSDQWFKNPTTAAELANCNETVVFFKKYAGEYVGQEPRGGGNHAGQAGDRGRGAHQHP